MGLFTPNLKKAATAPTKPLEAPRKAAKQALKVRRLPK